MMRSIGNRVCEVWRRVGLAGLVAIAFGLAASVPVPAHALIMGGEGNTPITDPGWPKGAAEVFNSRARVAWWEGPPFGGGQYHAECRGNTVEFQKTLESFAAIKSEKKRLVVHDGEGASFWLNTNSDPEKKGAAVIDWVFVVWVPDSFKRLQAMPARFRQSAPNGETEPVPQIDVYVGGRIIWADVEIPEGIDVVDERLEAHGFKISDGTVAEGTVVSVSDKKPIAAAAVRLERIEPQPTGGYHYEPVETKTADEKGHWAFRKIPTGWFRLIVEAEGYAPRVAGHLRPTGEPHWQAYNTTLARSAAVSGRVVDADGKPLGDVEVRISDFSVKGAKGEEESYASLDLETEFKTDADGRFRADRVPRGSASVWVHKKGYCRPGLGPKIEIPADDVTLTMVKASLIKVSVDFGGIKAPQGYLVQITPEGGDKVGSWGGSGNINDLSQIEFKDVPPGKYHLKGRPNPGSESEESAIVTVDLKGGETVDVKIEAKTK